VPFRSFLWFCIKTGGLPCGSPPTLILPLRVVCLESPPSQGLPNFGQYILAQLLLVGCREFCWDGYSKGQWT
jgi:hypothetical protein